jgi:hypothetical protein
MGGQSYGWLGKPNMNSANKQLKEKKMKLAKNIRNYIVTKIFGLSEAMFVGGYTATDPLGVSPAYGDETEDVSEVLGAILPETFKLFGEPQTKQDVLSAIQSADLPKLPVIVTGKHRACALCLVWALTKQRPVASTVDVTGDDSAQLRENAGRELTAKMSMKDIAVACLAAKDRYPTEADIMKAGVRRGTAQFAFGVLELTRLGMKQEDALSYSYSDGAKIRKAVALGLSLEQALENLKPKTVAGKSLKRTDLETLAAASKGTVFEPLLTAILAGSLEAARAAIATK